ncbi:MAG: hypothetical protein F4171_08610 [Gammaproteobacteria bacterium]|nr:hypothetical protein [Gammaproteobacteria bacterium]
MKLKHLFWMAFVLGAAVVVLGASADIPTPGWVRAVFAEWLSAPGVLITLPLHNLVEAWWWAILVIALGNGLLYGVVAIAIGKVSRRVRN